MANIDDIINSFNRTTLSIKGVSFQGRSLKLNSAEDGNIVVNAINGCTSLQFLNLEGNTLGVEAAEVIAKALEHHPEFKQALWKDMFTGRMKTEIPKALQYLGDGLVKAGAQLTILDLSDNAFGPAGVNGLASFLRSSSCYALEELRLNNNGLGIIGGKLLAKALLDCHVASSAAGKPLALRVFIAGRNRLENDGATVLADVFKTLGSLEEISMPQNGIYHVGISALSTALQHNKNLRVLNLNDNTIGPKSAAAISRALPMLPNLRQLNLGDCLLKTKGALSLASGIKSISGLESLILGYNDIRIEGGLALIDAVANHKMLRELALDGNQFDEDDRNEIERKLTEIGKQDIYTIDECDSEYEEEEEDEDDDEEKDEADDINDKIEELLGIENVTIAECSFNDFIVNPTGENFLGLGSNRENVILAEMKHPSNSFIDVIIPTLMKVSALTIDAQEDVSRYALKCSELLYSHLFNWVQANNAISLANNTLLVHLGLIKGEDKNFKPTWNIKGCLFALENIIGKNYIPDSTRKSLQMFIEKDIDKNVELFESKEKLMKLLKI